ncbi:transmembrane protein 116 [Myripristis murdjan]|uniref:transmembrane protein 116 n=1 Tax=Myripristis murdjan TaxID=586833 RepID=UPI0011763552|nr:transmembrane protein 116-like [Myripristis murdjan]
MGFNGTLSAAQIDILSTVYLVSLTPSLIGSFSVLVVSTVKWRYLQEQVQPLVQLALADLLATVILMFSSAMNKAGNLSNSVPICQHTLPLSLTFYFISFLLGAVYAWKSKNAIHGWRARLGEDEGEQTQCRRSMVAVPVYAIVWFMPIAMYFVYIYTPYMTTASLIPTDLNGMSYDRIKYCTSCLLFLHIWSDSCSDAEKYHDTFIRGFLIIIVILVMLSCSVIYYKIGRWYQRYEQEGLFPVEGDGRSRRRFKRMLSTARNMVIVIFISWAPALVLVVLSTLTTWTSIQQRSLFGLYFLQAVTVSLQGFLNSMVYAWRRPNFTAAVLGENTPLMAHGHQAFFDESLISTA